MSHRVLQNINKAHRYTGPIELHSVEHYRNYLARIVSRGSATSFASCPWMARTVECCRALPPMRNTWGDFAIAPVIQERRLFRFASSASRLWGRPLKRKTLRASSGFHDCNPFDRARFHPQEITGGKAADRMSHRGSRSGENRQGQ